MNNVWSGEEDDTVAVGVAVRKVNRAYLFAVEMHRQRLVERNHRQRFLRRRGRRLFEDFRVLLRGEPFANVVVRDDRGLWSKHRVWAGVISVEVRVENEAQLARIERL